MSPGLTDGTRRIPWLLLLGDFLFYLAVFIFAVWWRWDVDCVWGSAIALPSFVLWFIARLQLGSSFTARPEARELVTRGFYGKIRHPIYLFSTLAIVGIAICLRWWLFNLYVVLGVFLQLARIRLEEKVLLEKFGDAYIAYRRATWF